MYSCCIFDLDGTLLNTICALTHTTNLVLERYGLEPVDEAHIRLFVGDGYKKLMERALIYRGDEDLVHYEDALVAYMQIFDENCMHRVVPYDGIQELLSFIKGRGMKMGVLSNKPDPMTRRNIEEIFGAGYFDGVAGEQPGVPRKPDPAGALIMAERLGVNPSQCLYFGDTDTDMKTGEAAGMDTVGVSWGFRGRGELESFHPKYVIDDPRQAIEIIRRSE